MQRYFIDQDALHEPVIHADETMHRHMQKVMRNENGDQVICVDSRHQAVLCTIVDIDQGVLIREKDLDENHELDCEVTLIYGLPKGDRFELVLQKATELGVTRIVPFLSRRSIVRTDKKRFGKKYPRYQRIIQEAAEQCGRTYLPELTELVTIKELSTYCSEANIVAYEELSQNDAPHVLHDTLKQKPASITIVTGPEGGFDEDEITAMIAMGFEACSLGKRILRSETAPIYLLSVIGYERELVK